jgi:macrolide transport system ATP-binding/permease protein
LDSKSTADLLDLFARLNGEGLTLVIVTHDENVASRAGRRVHIIDGRLTVLSESEKNGQETLAAVKSGAVSRSGITLRDLFNEVIAGMFARPVRMVLTILGIVIGLTALVATVGLSRTAGNRIISQFDELVATEITVTARPGPGGVDPATIPWDAPERLLRLNGVVAAGTVSEVNVGDLLVSSSPIRDPQGQTAFNLAVKAASPDLFRAIRAELATGRFPDSGHSDRADRVAVLGPTAAERLGIVDLAQMPAIAIGDHLYLVIGILSGVGRQPDLLGSVILPEGTARQDFGLAGPGAVVIETQIGAASLIAQQTPLALRPDKPSVLRIELPPEPRRVRDAVQSDLNVMFLLLGGLSLIVGAIGIGNITLVSVMERTGEIGLRRAIGANRSHIAAQFLLESASMGVIGGILGASLGVLIVVAVSVVQVWTPVLDPAAPFLAPVVGGTIGLLSGAYPAMRAARLEPVEAFRN